MKYEKIYELTTGRMAKVIVQEENAHDFSKTVLSVLIEIKDPKDQTFHDPITSSHPQFWKLKRMDARQCSLLQFQYSGLSDKHIRKALREFKQFSEKLQLV